MFAADRSASMIGSDRRVSRATLVPQQRIYNGRQCRMASAMHALSQVALCVREEECTSCAVRRSEERNDVVKKPASVRFTSLTFLGRPPARTRVRGLKGKQYAFEAKESRSLADCTGLQASVGRTYM